MDLKNPRQNSANFSHNNDCADVSTQKNVKNKRFLKIFGAGTLAIMMGIGTLCGVLISPMNSAQANASANATTESALTPEEKLTAGVGLGLDPENDPVIFTTAGGIEIKYSGAIGSNASLGSGALSGYSYVTVAGTNWVIIGYDPSISILTQNLIGKISISKYPYKINATNSAEKFFSTLDSSPAANAIKAEMGYISANAKSNSEIGAGCVLCLSEKNLGDMSFDNTEDANGDISSNYADSGCSIRTYLNDYYNTNFSSTEKAQIQSKTIKTAYTNDLQNIYLTSISTKLFLLGAISYYDHTGNQQLSLIETSSKYAEQNFVVETYLTTLAKRVSYTKDTTKAAKWHLRTGGGNSYPQNIWVNSDGKTFSYVYADSVYSSRGCRPAFVLSLVES